jgi:hypothetical protein
MPLFSGIGHFKQSPYPTVKMQNLNNDLIWKEVRALREDPTQMESYNPDWVLRFLLKIHPQFFDQRDMKRVLADCVPHDKTRVKESRVVSYDWYWIVELLPSHSPKNRKRFVYLVGWFDPQLREPVSHLKAWFFPTQEEALSPAITGLVDGKWKREPDQRLYEFLKSQIENGVKVKRNPGSYFQLL